MKKTIQPALSLLLCMVIILSALFPASAADEQQNEPESDWQTDIVSMTHEGEEPFMKLRLTPKGYVFTDCYIPRHYEITFNDGDVVSVTISSQPDAYYDADVVYGDPVFINWFTCSHGEETIKLGAYVYYNERIKQGIFEIVQIVDGPDDAPDRVGYYTIIQEPCEVEIEEGNVLTRILYRFYALSWEIRIFFSRLRRNVEAS